MNVAADRIVDVGIEYRVPLGAKCTNRAESFALDPVTGVVYGSGSADGFVFVFDPATGVMRNLGKPGISPTIRCMSVDNAGRLDGIIGGADDIGHVFRYSPDEGSFADLGVPAFAVRCADVWLRLRVFGRRARW